MAINIDEIKSYISEISFVKRVYFLEQVDFSVKAKVEIAFDELNGSLDFDVEIQPQYPLKGYNCDSIAFINKELISYNHVMGNGSICVHTSHSTNLKQKLKLDFDALKNWVIKYYINKDEDSNYEHIIVNAGTFNNTYYAYIFTDVVHQFTRSEFGAVKILYLSNGIYKDQGILNFLVQGFIPFQKEVVKCQWSNSYANFESTHSSFYIFIEEVPAKHNRFIFKSWTDFVGIIPNDFLKVLHLYQEQNIKQLKGTLLPIFIGYRTVGTEIHWQVALWEVGKFPIYGMPERINDAKTGRWISELSDERILWALTRNSSYKFFFGRGTLSQKIIEKKILIIGIGAIGSMVSTTLTRGGCKDIDFVDYDVKEPENVCRSEYKFISGITNKTEEMRTTLVAISPFVNIQPLNNNYFETLIKTFHKDENYKTKFANEINNYDLIFDCSTDNDLMYVLNCLELKALLINMSITNHAKELVCAFHPNVYQFVNNQFSTVLENDVQDLYDPIGCWSPTFKASYNDINVLVQFALKHINLLFEEDKVKNNFVIKSGKDHPSNLEIIEY